VGLVCVQEDGNAAGRRERQSDREPEQGPFADGAQLERLPCQSGMPQAPSSARQPVLGSM
jgi:hypothetical protein